MPITPSRLSGSHLSGPDLPGPNLSGDVVARAAVPAAPAPIGDRPTIIIIGGGFSGAAVAYHLAAYHEAKAAPGAVPASELDIVVFEPRAEIGRGLAYDTAEPAHRINVPASRMSLLPDDPDHFSRWLAHTAAVSDDPEATRPDGALFPRRGVFGAYVFDALRPFLASGAVRHVRSAVETVRRTPSGWEVTDASGARTNAAIVVVATTHPPPTAPGALAAVLEGHPRFVPDPTQRQALAAIRPGDDVLIVGNGLTSADVVASLIGKGHTGRLLSVSRRGLRSRGHASAPLEPFGDFLDPPVTSARDLTHRVRAAIRAAAAAGLSWHAVIDQVRTQAGTFWPQLSVTERRRIVRHLRVFWDVHRFRIAPQVEDALDRAVRRGQLEILAGSVRDTRLETGRVHVTLRPKGGHAPVERVFDAVVVTTGPAHGGILESQSWLEGLGQAGHLRLDPIGLGLDCDGRARAIGADGAIRETLLVAGPLARGRFGELMGLPQVSAHAVLVAGVAMETLRSLARTGDDRPLLAAQA